MRRLTFILAILLAGPVMAQTKLSGVTVSGLTCNPPAGSQPAFSVTPTSLSEGSVLTGTKAYFQTVTVQNTGAAPLTFSSIGFTGTNASDFSVTAGFSSIPNPVPSNSSIRTTGSFTTGSNQVTVTSATGIVPGMTIYAEGDELTGGLFTVSTIAGTTLTLSGNATDTNSVPVILTVPECSTATSVPAGQECLMPVDFVPGGTGSRTAALTFTDNAPGSPHTVALTGTGVGPTGTVLTNAMCNTLLSNANGTYYAAGNLSCPGSGFGINADGITVNLNGYTLTTGASPAYAGLNSSAFYNAPSYDPGYGGTTCTQSGAPHPCLTGTTQTTGSANNFTLENGTVVLAGAAGSTVNTSTNQAGDSVWYADADGTTLHDLTVNIPVNCISCSVNSAYRGTDNTYNGVDDRTWNLTINDDSGLVYNRCEYEGAALIYNNNASTADPGPIAYENRCTQSPQDCIATTVFHSYLFGNSGSIGNPNGTDAGTASTCSGIGTGPYGTMSVNGFDIGMYGSYSFTVNNNFNNSEGRGVDITTGNAPQISALSAGNTIVTTDLPNYVEYNGGTGCSIGGGYGIRMNNFGVASATGYQSINDVTTATANQCDAIAFSLSSISNPNNAVQNQNMTCLLATGHGNVNCTAIQDASTEYGNTQPILIQGGTYTGATSDVAIANADAAYGGPITFLNSTFGMPAVTAPARCAGDIEPVWSVLNSCDVGIPAATLGPVYFINPTYTNGAQSYLTDFAFATTVQTSGTIAQLFIQYVYQVTVTGAVSGTPIAGATLTATDTHGTVECTATTNAAGVAECNGQTALGAANPALNNTQYSYTAPNAPVTTTYNPFSFSITKSGCTTNTYGETISGDVTETKTLGSC